MPRVLVRAGLVLQCKLGQSQAGVDEEVRQLQVLCSLLTPGKTHVQVKTSYTYIYIKLLLYQYHNHYHIHYIDRSYTASLHRGKSSVSFCSIIAIDCNIIRCNRKSPEQGRAHAEQLQLPLPLLRQL